MCFIKPFFFFFFYIYNHCSLVMSLLSQARQKGSHNHLHLFSSTQSSDVHPLVCKNGHENLKRVVRLREGSKTRIPKDTKKSDWTLDFACRCVCVCVRVWCRSWRAQPPETSSTYTPQHHHTLLVKQLTGCYSVVIS